VAAVAAKMDLTILAAGLKPGVEVFPRPRSLPEFKNAFIGPYAVNSKLLKAYQVVDGHLKIST